MKHLLLTDDANQVYLVDCELLNGRLKVGYGKFEICNQPKEVFSIGKAVSYVVELPSTTGFQFNFYLIIK